MKAIANHWMRVEPLNRNAWPDYSELARAHGIAALTHLRDGHIDAAVDSVRSATRNAWIDIFGRMTPAELKAEGF